MKEKVFELLKNLLPKQAYFEVTTRKKFYGGEYLKIAFAVSAYCINDVRGQMVQVVSLMLDLDTLELHPQVYGGNGGQRIYRKPKMDDSKEKYLAMVGIKIPFRKPKQEEKFVLSAIERFANNWVKLLKENKDQLMYQDLIDYDEFFNSYS